MITVILPTFNEADHIEQTILSLARQAGPGDEYEILVIDGRSQDETVNVAERVLQAEGANGRVLINERRTVPHAVEIGLSAAQGDRIVIGGAHAVYPPNYLRELKLATDDPKVGAAGGTLRALPADPSSSVSLAIADTMDSWFGVGLSHRTGAIAGSKVVNTVAFPMYRREVFADIGGYDVEFPRAQDLEFHVRMRQAGWKLRLIREVRVGYVVRKTFLKEAGMAYKYGYWKPAVNRRRGELTSLQQLLPPALLTVLSASALLILFGRRAWLGFFFPSLYLVSLFFGSLALGLRRKRTRLVPLYVFSFAVLHLGYGAGYLIGALLGHRSGQQRPLSPAPLRGRRILHVGKYYPPRYGGIETVTQRFVTATNSSSSGWHSDVLCFSSGRISDVSIDGSAVIIRKGTIVAANSTPLSVRYVLALRRLSKQYDILHVHLPNPLAVVGLFVTDRSARIAIQWHSDVVRQTIARGIYYAMLRLLRKNVEVVIGATDVHLSQSHVDAVLSGVPKKVVPFFLPQEAQDSYPPTRGSSFSTSVREVLDSEKRVVFSLGRMVGYKGYPYLIRATRYLPDDYVVAIGGDGPLYPYLTRLAKVRGRQVAMLGRLTDAEALALFRKAEVFCLPSITPAEMFGMVQLEAFREGVPVVGTRIPGSGTTRVNLDGVTGVIVPPRDAESLAGGIRNVVENRELHCRLSAQARRIFEERFSEPAVIPHLIDVYEDCLSNPKGEKE